MLFCKSCYTQKCIYAKNLIWQVWKTPNPSVSGVSKKVKDFLKTKEFQCPNFCDAIDDFTYQTYVTHINDRECDSFNYEKVDGFLKRIEEIKENDQWYEITTSEHKLKADWDVSKAICQICKYLAKLDGYIWYIWSAVCCKEECEAYTHSEKLSTDDEYHPYGLKLCGICKKFTMVKIDRVPSIYDSIVERKIPQCENQSEECKARDLHYIQMLQHQEVCLKEKDESLNPVKLDYLPYVCPSGDKVVLIDPVSPDSLKLNDFDTKMVEQKIKLGHGFKVCLLRDTNQVFIVGGKGSETKTFIFNPETNFIESTEYDLIYARMGHSLCSGDNKLVCTGSSILESNDSLYTCRRVEVFAPEWGGWREGVSMNEDRCDHFSICTDGTVYAIFGNSPRYNSCQDGIEYINLNKIYGTQGSWRFEGKVGSWKLTERMGFLPYPYDKKFIILGKVENDDYSSWEDEDVVSQNIYDSNTVEKDGLEKREYNESENKFDLNNMPMFYMGSFFVFGENGSTIYKCTRDFVF